MTSSIVFEFPTEEQKALVRESVGTSTEDIHQAVSTIRSWLQSQPHLPHVIDDGRLERMYISCKCSIEKTKKSVDAYYTLKSKFPQILMNRDPLADDFKDTLNYVTLLTMPQPTKDFHRVGCLTGICPDSTGFNMEAFSKAVLMGIDLILSYDYTIGYIFFMDMRNLSAAHVIKMGIRDIRALELIVRRAYSKRIVGLHFVNAPKAMDMLLSIIMPAIPEKLRKRVHVHLPGSETPFEHISKDFLPNEMGGTGGPAKQISNSVTARLIERREWFLEEDKYVTDESKRPPESSYDYDLFGVDGSFKKLQVD